MYFLSNFSAKAPSFSEATEYFVLLSEETFKCSGNIML